MPLCPVGIGEVGLQIWSAPVDLTPVALARLSASLSTGEWGRANRYLEERDRSRFVARRGWLRYLLAATLEVDPRQLEFDYGPDGKPSLAGSSANRLRFSLSHSGGLALFALSEGMEVGVDLEEVRADFPVEAVASRFFTPGEQKGLAELTESRRIAAFFSLWTRKEAYLKGVGMGLNDLGLRVDTGRADSTNVPLRIRGARGRKALGWSIGSVNAGAGYSAAIAAQAPDRSLPHLAQPVWPVSA